MTNVEQYIETKIAIKEVLYRVLYRITFIGQIEKPILQFVDEQNRERAKKENS